MENKHNITLKAKPSVQSENCFAGQIHMILVRAMEILICYKIFACSLGQISISLKSHGDSLQICTCSLWQWVDFHIVLLLVCQQVPSDDMVKITLGRIGVSLIFRYHGTREWNKVSVYPVCVSTPYSNEPLTDYCVSVPRCAANRG